MIEKIQQKMSGDPDHAHKGRE